MRRILILAFLISVTIQLEKTDYADPQKSQIKSVWYPVFLTKKHDIPADIAPPQ